MDSELIESVQICILRLSLFISSVNMSLQTLFAPVMVKSSCRNPAMRIRLVCAKFAAVTLFRAIEQAALCAGRNYIPLGCFYVRNGFSMFSQKEKGN